MVSKKKIKVIEDLSLIRPVLEKHGHSFQNYAPDPVSWFSEDYKLWDLLTELEDQLKKQVVEILQRKKI